MGLERQSSEELANRLFQGMPMQPGTVDTDKLPTNLYSQMLRMAKGCNSRHDHGDAARYNYAHRRFPLAEVQDVFRAAWGAEAEHEFLFAVGVHYKPDVLEDARVWSQESRVGFAKRIIAPPLGVWGDRCCANCRVLSVGDKRVKKFRGIQKM
eukprot:CAMPEP_0117489070 /NCGR_PEP_ID=MMETSP0784-20121206/16843_1 /TAXON_ID=39447 /ORGANISM="" /LENGTH=152 /DNA_ID=CAMNT_0005283781 /DNA_START=437 /DNA_END=895 /DNA_ORIENTATION=-